MGLDRIDYTKGIPERLLAIDRLLEKHPEAKEKIIFLQMGEISRLHIPKYKALNDEINALVEEINWKHSTDSWKPVILVRRHLSFHELLAFYRIGEICVVSSLHDGMNLVSKEFASSRSDERGTLILSQFTGSSRELTDAILINPFDREEFSDAIFNAFSLSEEESSKRIKKMRQIVQQNNIYFDRLKDPIGVIEMFRQVKRHNDCQLILAGGTAIDDPEGTKVLDEVREKAAQSRDIHILLLPQNDIEVNALQRASTVIVQKSIKEGFGLTVTEALWKAKPVVASNLGGIPLQIKHRYSGLLCHSIEGAAFAIKQLLNSPEFAKKLGENGRQHIRDNFLITRHLRDYMLLCLSLFREGDIVYL